MDRSETMRAMLLDAAGRPLRLARIAMPQPAAGQVLIRVRACGVCRTDLHIADGDLPLAKSPLVPGHEIVGEIVGLGDGVAGLVTGQRVGVPWLGWTCGECDYCRGGRENLCQRARFTGCHIDGGYAEYAVADERYCFSIPDAFDDIQAAPLLCAGLIGWRCLRAAGDAERIGFYGFGAAAHILAQIAKHQGRTVLAFTRPGDEPAQRSALELGAEWAGDSTAAPPAPLDAAILFAPVGALLPAALRSVVPGGTVICGGIHMSDIPSFPYEILWGERVVRSVANLTREDAREFLAVAPAVPVRTDVHVRALEAADAALADLRAGRFQGAAVLVP